MLTTTPRDLSVLRALVDAHSPGTTLIDVADLCRRGGIDVDVARHALTRLSQEQPLLFHAVLDPDGSIIAITRVTDHARRLVDKPRRNGFVFRRGLLRLAVGTTLAAICKAIIERVIFDESHR